MMSTPRWNLVLGIGAPVVVAGTVCSVIMVNAMAPRVVSVPTPSVEASHPSVVKGLVSDAVKSVQSVTASMPASLSGLGTAATAPSRPVANTCVTPVASSTRAWSGGSWLNPSGIVLTVQAYPPGMGAKAAKCATGSVVRRGDVVAEVTVTNTSADMSVVAKAMSAITGCADPSETPDQSSRNPLSDNYAGLWSTQKVVMPDAIPEQPKAFSPITVSLPETPSFPHAPAALPVPPLLPPSATPPAKPSSTGNAKVQLEDTVGPGCGWSFTGQEPPAFDKASVDKANAASVSAELQRLRQNLATYKQQLASFSSTRARFDELNPNWLTYSKTIQKIASGWAEQGKVWSAWKSAHDQWESDVQDRADFLSRQKKAREEFDRQTTECQTPITVTTTAPAPVSPITIQPAPVTTYPSPPAGSAPGTVPSPVVVTPPPVITTPDPTMTPTSYTYTPQCPSRPDILDQQAPSVGPEPVEPTPKA